MGKVKKNQFYIKTTQKNWVWDWNNPIKKNITNHEAQGPITQYWMMKLEKKSIRKNEPKKIIELNLTNIWN